MPDQLPNITFRRGGHPNPRKTILHQQIEDVQSIPVVCLLFAHHRRADLRRIANPQFMPIVTEHLFEPLRGEGGFYADADGSRQCSIKPLGLARAMLQAARYKFARRGIHHCDFLKPCVKSHPIINIVARLLSSEPWSKKPLPSLLARREPTTLSNQLTAYTYKWIQARQARPRRLLFPIYKEHSLFLFPDALNREICGFFCSS